MDKMDNLIDFGKRLHTKRVAEEERETAQAIAGAKAAVKAERERSPPPHPWVLMSELVHALRPELTKPRRTKLSGHSCAMPTRAVAQAMNGRSTWTTGLRCQSRGSVPDGGDRLQGLQRRASRHLKVCACVLA